MNQQAVIDRVDLWDPTVVPLEVEIRRGDRAVQILERGSRGSPPERAQSFRTLVREPLAQLARRRPRRLGGVAALRASCRGRTQGCGAHRPGRSGQEITPRRHNLRYGYAGVTRRSRLLGLAAHRTERVDDLCWFGKPRLIVLREDHLAVRHDIEDAVAALDQLGFELEHILDLGCQTGGLGKIPSTPTVGD